MIDPEKQKEIQARYETLLPLISEVPEELVYQVNDELKDTEVWENVSSNREFDVIVFEEAIKRYQEDEAKTSRYAA